MFKIEAIDQNEHFNLEIAHGATFDYEVEQQLFTFYL